MGDEMTDEELMEYEQLKDHLIDLRNTIQLFTTSANLIEKRIFELRHNKETK
jgi:hypothetical protein